MVISWLPFVNAWEQSIDSISMPLLGRSVKAEGGIISGYLNPASIQHKKGHYFLLDLSGVSKSLDAWTSTKPSKNEGVNVILQHSIRDSSFLIRRDESI